MNFLRLTLLLYLSISICADGWAEEKKNTKEKTTEQQLAEFLEKAAIAETELRMATLQTRIDEMKDLCALEPEQSSKLTLAAKGAVEGSLDNWRQWIQSYATSQIERHKGKNLEAAFAQIAQVRYGGNETLLILKSDLWTNALKENLTSAPSHYRLSDGQPGFPPALLNRSTRPITAAHFSHHREIHHQTHSTMRWRISDLPNDLPARRRGRRYG